ncbi:tetratricopeptide repeat protein [Chitinimonas naiadis]
MIRIRTKWNFVAIAIIIAVVVISFFLVKDFAFGTCCDERLNDAGLSSLIGKAKAGDSEASFALFSHFDSMGDNLSALHWLRISASQGRESANSRLVALLLASSIPSERKEGAELILSQAKAGSAIFEYQLGNEIYAGKIFEKNQELASDWWARAANQGYKDAMIRYARHIAETAETSNEVASAMAWGRVVKLCASKWGEDKVVDILKVIDQKNSSFASKDELEGLADSRFAELWNKLKNSTAEKNMKDQRFCAYDQR